MSRLPESLIEKRSLSDCWVEVRLVFRRSTPVAEYVFCKPVDEDFQLTGEPARKAIRSFILGMAAIYAKPRGRGLTRSLQLWRKERAL